MYLIIFPQSTMDTCPLFLYWCGSLWRDPTLSNQWKCLMIWLSRFANSWTTPQCLSKKQKTNKCKGRKVSKLVSNLKRGSFQLIVEFISEITKNRVGIRGGASSTLHDIQKGNRYHSFLESNSRASIQSRTKSSFSHNTTTSDPWRNNASFSVNSAITKLKN